MTKYKPLSSMTTPRFADVATFFRLPIIKDLTKLDYCICGIPWDGGTTNRPGARHGPREIRSASSLVRLYHPVSLKSPYDKYNVADIGDCPVNPADLNDSLKKISSLNKENNVVIHNNLNVFDSFSMMIHNDAFVGGFSNLSYIAHLLSNKRTIFPQNCSFGYKPLYPNIIRLDKNGMLEKLNSHRLISQMVNL